MESYAGDIEEIQAPFINEIDTLESGPLPGLLLGRYYSSFYWVYRNYPAILPASGERGPGSW
jgi:hypothetical protein